MENKNRWFVKKNHYLNADDYDICMQDADSRTPAVCIGSFRGIDELRKFGAQLRGYLVEGGHLRGHPRRIQADHQGNRRGGGVT